MNDTTYLVERLKEGYSLEDALKEATLPTVGQYLMANAYVATSVATSPPTPITHPPLYFAFSNCIIIYLLANGIA